MSPELLALLALSAGLEVEPCTDNSVAAAVETGAGWQHQPLAPEQPEEGGPFGTLAAEMVGGHATDSAGVGVQTQVEARQYGAARFQHANARAAELGVCAVQVAETRAYGAAVTGAWDDRIADRLDWRQSFLSEGSVKVGGFNAHDGADLRLISSRFYDKRYRAVQPLNIPWEGGAVRKLAFGADLAWWHPLAPKLALVTPASIEYGYLERSRGPDRTPDLLGFPAVGAAIGLEYRGERAGVYLSGGIDVVALPAWDASIWGNWERFSFEIRTQSSAKDDYYGYWSHVTGVGTTLELEAVPNRLSLEGAVGFETQEVRTPAFTPPVGQTRSELGIAFRASRSVTARLRSIQREYWSVRDFTLWRQPSVWGSVEVAAARR